MAPWTLDTLNFTISNEALVSYISLLVLRILRAGCWRSYSEAGELRHSLYPVILATVLFCFCGQFR